MRLFVLLIGTHEPTQYFYMPKIPHKERPTVNSVAFNVMYIAFNITEQ